MYALFLDNFYQNDYLRVWTIKQIIFMINDIRHDMTIAKYIYFG